MNPRIPAICFLALVLAVPAAHSKSRPVPADWVFDLSGEGGFFDLPFPTELRRRAGGGLDVSDFPSPKSSEMAERIKKDFGGGYGYSTAPVIYFRFNVTPDPASFPGPKEVMGSDGPLFLADIDPGSPDFGKRYPVMARVFEDSPRWVKGADNVVAMMPVPGFVLREETLYAAGVKRGLGAEGGRELFPSAELADMAHGVKPSGKLGGKALELYGPALAKLAGMGIEAGDLAALTVFRTGDPTRRMRDLFDGAVKTPIEVETELSVTREHGGFYVLEGAVMMPQFQKGEAPFWRGKGGDIEFDSKGEPVEQWRDRTPVCVTIPKGKMPAGGFPFLIYIHGTSGISTQFADRGVVMEEGEDPEPGTGPAMVLAHRGIATAAAAQLRNRQRGGSPGKETFHNVLNPKAYRDNYLQSSVEQALLLRYLQNVEIDPALCPETDAGGGPVRLDPNMIFAMGQSMGSETLGPWAGVETDLGVVIHSGHGPFRALQISEGNQFNLGFLKKRGQGTGEGLLGMDRYHPLLNLLAQVMAPADSFAFEPHYYKRPLPGRPAKHVWVSFGTDDHYFPPSTQNGSILSMGLDLAGPAIIPGTEEMLKLAGLDMLDYPARLNKESPGGPVTAVTVQYEAAPPLDGHNINFQREDTRYQYGCFLKTMAETGAPTLFAPRDSWSAPCE